jgi:hypothetical protein
MNGELYPLLCFLPAFSRNNNWWIFLVHNHGLLTFANLGLVNAQKFENGVILLYIRN